MSCFIQTALALSLLLITSNVLGASSPEPVDLRELQKGAISVGLNSELLTDPHGHLKLDDVLLADQKQWQNSESDIPSFGFSLDVHWMRFAVQNDSQVTVDFLMDVAYPLLDDVQVYHLRDGQLIATKKTGDLSPFHDREIKHRDFIFLFSVPPEGSDQFYIRVQSSSAIQIPVLLWEEQTFFTEDQLSLYVNGIYAGIVFIMVFYNFFLYLKIRDRAFLYYVCYAAAFVIIQMTVSGFSYQYFWPNSPDWNQISIAVLAPLSVIFGAPFAWRIMELRDFHPRLQRALQLMVVLGLVCLVLSFVLPYGTIMPFSTLNAAVTATVALSIAVYAWARRPTHHTGFFILGWSFFLIGVTVLALSKLGLIPRVFYTEYAAQLGSVIEVVLLSYALATRFQDETNNRLVAQREANNANRKLLEIEIENRAQLEQQVVDRTQALEEALNSVKVLNRELEKTSITDALTGTKNRYMMRDNIESELKRAERTQRACSLMLIDIDHFKQVNDSFGHQTGDVCIQHVANSIREHMRMPPDDIFRYGGEEFLVLLPETSSRAAMVAAERIRKQLADHPFQHDKSIHYLTVSIGIATSTENVTESVEQLIDQADQALYQAKNAGRNRSAVYQSK